MTVIESEVAARLAAVRGRITDAGGRVDDVDVLAVTKGFGPDAVVAAHAVGLSAMGESYAQELVAKAELVGGVPTVRWHFIGRLQRNKIRLLAGLVTCWQSIDRIELGREIAKRAPGAQVYVQVSAWNESAKGGVELTAVPALVDELRALGLDVSGLMAVAPHGEPGAARAGFAEVRTLAGRLELPNCSMGMSDDLEVAVAEGSTQVRLGRALFGPRSVRAAVGN